jgi:hypothetical protein
MNQAQVTYFYTAARCCWSKYVAKAVAMARICDPSAKQLMVNSVVVNRLLATVECYNPQAENNCLSWEEMEMIMNKIMSILGLCGTLENLPEADNGCCNCLDNVELLNLT